MFIILSCSLLKTVTKEHLKDDFDSLFKHLSSDQKTVTVPQQSFICMRNLIYYLIFKQETFLVNLCDNSYRELFLCFFLGI